MSINTLFTLSGQVVRGQQLGRTIGFPTANIQADELDIPTGVFAVQLIGINELPINGVANVGTRPTVDGILKNVEVHLFNFNQDIYFKQVRINFLHKIRNEQKFDGLTTLQQQIQQDCNVAQQFFKNEVVNSPLHQISQPRP